MSFARFTKRFTRMPAARDGRGDTDTLDFRDRGPANFAVPLTPPPNALSSMSAGQTYPPRGPPSHQRRNEKEQQRLQGLMRTNSILEVDGKTKGPDVASRGEKFAVWMINEGKRRAFVAVWLLLHALVFGLGFVHYQLKDNLSNNRAMFSYGFPVARSAALVLHVDVAFILLPICRNFISLLRRGPLNGVIPFEKNITFHKFTAWSIVFFTVVHVGAHIYNVIVLAISASDTAGGRVVAFLGLNFASGPGITGWIMNFALGAMVWTAMEKRRRANFNRFYYTHHLFIVFFINWQLHGMFCMLKPDRPPFCDYNTIGVFWKYWLVGGLVYIYERILREVRSRHRTYVSKVILHPSKVCEIQFKKEKTTTRAGQYIMVNVPEISYFQWHAFTLSSAPEEDYISIHMRIVGDFTTAFATALGCELGKKDKNAGAAEVAAPLNRVLPRVMIDGPFGSASEDVFKYEVSVLVGAGIGCTPFASILKSIWYRLNFPQPGKKTRLGKVYFFWICRDYDSFEWFQSLLLAIEEQDLDSCIEIHTYLTARIKEDDINNIVVQDVGGEKDTVTSLRSPTHYGRPNWDKIFASIRDKHPSTEAGVFFCGPKVLGSTLHVMCNKHSQGSEDGTKFIWGAENF